MLATVIAFGMFRFTNEAWPLYWFLLLGIVHLYAIVFTRGAALGSAMWFLAAATVIAGVWAAGHSHIPTTGAAGALARGALTGAPVLGWLLATTYMLFLGRQSLSKIAITSSYFLAAATLILGFWGVWLFYLENGLASATIYHVVVFVGPLLPVLSTLLLFALPRRHAADKDEKEDEDRAERRRWLLSLSALALVAFSANLILIRPLIDVLAFVLGRFIPRLVGVAPLNEVATDWLGGQSWRTAVTSATLLVALALVAVQAAQETGKEEAGPSVEMRDESNPGQVIAGQVMVAPSRSTELGRVSAVVAPPEVGIATQATSEASFQARFLGQIAYRIVANILTTLRRALQAVLPSVAFSLLGILIVLVLGNLGDYLRHGPFHDAPSLWGMALCIPVGAVVLCGIAFDFAPTERASEWKGLRILGVPFMMVAAGSLLCSLGYFLASLVSWALLPVLWPGSTPIRSLLFGDLYIVNLALSTVVLGLLAGLYRISSEAEKSPSTSRLPGRLFSLSAALILVAVAIASLYLGAAPIGTTVAYANGPYSTIASQALRGRLPPAFVGRCSPDYLLVPGQEASVLCRDVDTAEVSYHAFGTADDLQRWYRAALHARGVAIGAGSCGQNWPAENAYASAGRAGRLACYRDRRGVWLLWTDNRELGIAFRSDGRADALYASWSAGSYRLGAQ